MSLPANEVWESFKLNNNTIMPAVGLGMFKIRKDENVMQTIDVALATGYRLFDTAAVSKNDTQLQQAFKELLPKYDLEREDLFIASKLAHCEMYSKNVVKKAYKNSCNNLGTEYLDLFSINFPAMYQLGPTNSKQKAYRSIAWSALTELYDDNLVNAVGVSNFTANNLLDLIKEEHGVIPAVNQVEWHPYSHDDELSKVCNQYEIQLQGYSPFGGQQNSGTVLHDPTVKAIAMRVGMTPAQVLLTWSLQSNVAITPRSTDPNRIRDNFMFDGKLNDGQMKAINKLKNKIKKNK